MKNNKGFTLIELLVVVAIIGILAAVGTVAYTGYTASAQKNASKTLYSQSVKYLTAEIQKCILNPSGTAIEGKITCNADPSPSDWAEKFEEKSTDKNPHNSSEDAVSVAAAGTTEGTLYVTAVDGGWNSCLFRLRSRYTTKICRKHVNDNRFSTNRRDV